jgi:GNAT superfamily N-acetyltransferase
MSTPELHIRPICAADFDEVLCFTDVQIGESYFTPQKLSEIFKASKKGDVVTSYLLVDKDQKVHGVRLSYPPGQWVEREAGQTIHPHLWGVEESAVGYFQSLFLAPAHQGSGWGRKLSMASIEALKSVGSKAVVCHSWNESPNDSSRRYLLNMGFRPVIEIPNFWNQVQYSCTRCGEPCVCTATEMVKEI